MVDTSSHQYKSSSEKYFNAASLLIKMLSGEIPLKLKDAIWIVESTNPNVFLSYREYCHKIDKLKNIVKYVLLKENLKHSSLSLNYGIQRLYSDTIKVIGSDGKVIQIHYPLIYDFEDYLGERDYTKLFVTKLLTTGKGQCNSMPLLYLILAEELGTEAFLSYSPNHSYIQVKDLSGRFFNFETTNGRITTRDWLVNSNYLKAEAIQSKIYLYPLSRKQVVAECLIHLASAYINDFGYDNFPFECAKTCIEVFPYSVRAPMIIANYGTAIYINAAYKLGFPPSSELDRYPDLQALRDETVRINTQLEMMGYEDMPKTIYENWLKSVEKEKEHKHHKDMTSQIKRSIK